MISHLSRNHVTKRSDPGPGVSPVTRFGHDFAESAEIRHTCVVKKTGALQHPDERTRQGVARLLLEQGPVTAAAVADALGISPAAVRRHLDALVADGQACTREAPRLRQRGRGRPAKLFLLTEQGRAMFGHAYDDIAIAAIRFLAEHGGPDAVRAFAAATGRPLSSNAIAQR